ncbi:MAG: hypothetical protein HC918_09975 [Oscillatoriales cyanobacterium SM2_1_8]|nr:hypothetical protein [Oscillatoriales cyanobacterium SM2_1_8]
MTQPSPFAPRRRRAGFGPAGRTHRSTWMLQQIEQWLQSCTDEEADYFWETAQHMQRRYQQVRLLGDMEAFLATCSPEEALYFWRDFGHLRAECARPDLPGFLARKRG